MDMSRRARFRIFNRRKREAALTEAFLAQTAGAKMANLRQPGEIHA